MDKILHLGLFQIIQWEREVRMGRSTDETKSTINC